MASPSLFTNVPRRRLDICARCAFRASKLSSRTTRRWIGLKYLAKVREAEKQWEERAIEIRGDQKKSMLTMLEERGYINQIAGGRDALDKLMTDKRIGAYVGIDPTASSLHIGHLLPLMSLFWMYLHGFHAVSLLGGATAKIGDPSDRLVSREKQKAAVRTANMVNMHYQLKRLWGNVELYGKRYGYDWEWAWHRELVNNNAWLNKLSILEFLQIIGPGARMGTMLGKDTVKNKMEKGDGMSYAEFTYPLLQAWDWWHMYNTKGIQLQIGGSDQYGNIVAGIEAVKYISAHHPDPDVRAGKDSESAAPVGFTVPLLTTSAGEKFGKSAGNAIWLDKEQTSSFDLYGYFVRTADADVGRYLRLFTFVPLEDVETVVKEHMEDAKLRKAQHLLAREVVELIHGPEEAKDAESRHRLLFRKPATISTLETRSLENVAKTGATPEVVTLNNAPAANIKLPSSLIHAKSIGKILYAAGLAASASEGHRLAGAGGIYVGGKSGQKAPMDSGELKFTPVKTWAVEDTARFLVGGKLLILRKGKHNIRIIEVVPDDDWKSLRLKYPGEGSQEIAHDIDGQSTKTKGKGLWHEFAEGGVGDNKW